MWILNRSGSFQTKGFTDEEFPIRYCFGNSVSRGTGQSFGHRHFVRGAGFSALHRHPNVGRRNDEHHDQSGYHSWHPGPPVCQLLSEMVPGQGWQLVPEPE